MDVITQAQTHKIEATLSGSGCSIVYETTETFLGQVSVHSIVRPTSQSISSSVTLTIKHANLQSPIALYVYGVEGEISRVGSYIVDNNPTSNVAVDLDLKGKRIKNLEGPFSGKDAANKSYVAALIIQLAAKTPKSISWMYKLNYTIYANKRVQIKYYIHIEANYNTLHSRIVLENGYKVDFSGAGTIREILGFSSREVSGDGYQESEKIVNITEVESLQINCDLITNSYVNGSTSSVLYSLSPNVPPGYLIQFNPPQRLEVDITKNGLINSIRFFVTNQSGKLVDMNNERVTYFLHLNDSD